jgi:hypothetical protein
MGVLVGGSATPGALPRQASRKASVTWGDSGAAAAAATAAAGLAHRTFSPLVERSEVRQVAALSPTGSTASSVGPGMRPRRLGDHGVAGRSTLPAAAAQASSLLGGVLLNDCRRTDREAQWDEAPGFDEAPEPAVSLSSFGTPQRGFGGLAGVATKAMDSKLTAAEGLVLPVSPSLQNVVLPVTDEDAAADAAGGTAGGFAFQVARAACRSYRVSSRPGADARRGLQRVKRGSDQQRKTQTARPIMD